MLNVGYEVYKNGSKKYRLAVVNFDEESEEKYVRIDSLMHIKGWELDRVDWCAQCEVSDKEEYKEFMEDWKEAKKCITNCMKYGF